MAATENYTTEKEFAGRYYLGDRTLSNPEIYLTEAALKKLSGPITSASTPS